ncbi:pyruvate, water dikinase regulatory protein [Vagococcus xieshaowenii]|uniref:Putative pyruvate, phosphate dikinase regulatory protein n=1 Tax=Vagococcus xieshaowenii TaxID=2562451 RepID=A0AAJ5JMK3_9ENTE|nr:pyruvate, water dikinase regulatory protein [Vagococcus xieshaowenii]QCA28290.1 kinase/pyrophosphorylase [Vagococcus xieshaowenii]TFZ42322.1 kinase/pyrophosphorylase [Vagococcus xieshaowenii]
MSIQKQSIYIISDSAGETASNLANAATAQYGDVEFNLVKNIFITEFSDLTEILANAKKQNAMVIHTLITDEFIAYVNDFCKENKLFCLDILSPLVSEIQQRTHVNPTKLIGAAHTLNKEYFKRMDAMEFAVTYDDGKDPKGFLEADIVLLGVSRTSKTPLSLFLANKNIKVANLPIVPQSTLPKEIWQVDPKKIVGLTNDPSILNKIRQQRMIAYGLDPDTAYSDINNINQELDYAQKLYDMIGCIVINVANRSIEETSSMILHLLEIDECGYFGE